jgi:hypothetical protein
MKQRIVHFLQNTLSTRRSSFYLQLAHLRLHMSDTLIAPGFGISFCYRLIRGSIAVPDYRCDHLEAKVCYDSGITAC